MANRNGFTLLEMMVTVTILGIAAAIAIPSFGALIRSNRSVTQANDLLGSLQLARSEAVKRGQAVRVCASVNPAINKPTCSGDPNWSSGWIVRMDGTTDVIRVHGALEGGSKLKGTGSSESFVTFGRDGSHEKGTESLTLTLDEDGDALTRRICIAQTGRPEVRTDACP